MDLVFREICEKVRNQVPGARGITLVGSKARGEKNIVHDEYDLVVEIPTVFIPFIILKLKKIERDMSSKLGAKLSLNPIPTIRIETPKNNVLYHEIKEYGITICGKDLPSRLNLTNRVTEIPKIAALNYLFNSTVNLIRVFDTRYLFDTPHNLEKKEMEYISLKTISQCCDSLLLFFGFYTHKLEDRINSLSNSKFRTVFMNERNISLSDLISFSRSFISFRETNQHDLTISPVDIWFQAKRYLEETFRFLFYEIYRFEGSFLELGDKYLKHSNISLLNKFQYLLTYFFLKKRLNFKLILSSKSPCVRYRSAILHLLSSIDKHYIDENKLKHISSILFLNDEIQSKNILIKWNFLKNEVCEGLKYSCLSLI